MARQRIAPGPLWRISVTTAEEAEDAVFSMMERLCGEVPSTYLDVETRLCSATVFVKSLPEKGPALKAKLAGELEFVRSCGLDIGPGAIAITRVKRADWAESWKKHFQPIRFGARLLIKPSWSKLNPRKSQAVVVLDPGLSFGTGQHATTRFCLKQLVEHRQPGAPQSFLDIGTGSGILAIAAARLGCAPVKAFDFDPQSVRVASANARKNRVESRVSISRQDLRKISRTPKQRFDLVCANLTADLLASEIDAIINRVKPGGRLVLAGILASQFPKIQSIYEAAGLKLVETAGEREWRSGAFIFASR